MIWVRSVNCGCLVTWFCYQLKTYYYYKTASVLWPGPYIVGYGTGALQDLCTTASQSRDIFKHPCWLTWTQPQVNILKKSDHVVCKWTALHKDYDSLHISPFKASNMVIILHWASTHQAAKTSYPKILWSLEAARLDIIMIVIPNVYHSKIWQAFRQQCCRDAHQISEWLTKSKLKSRGFQTSWDLAVRCPSTWWIEAQELVSPSKQCSQFRDTVLCQVTQTLKCYHLKHTEMKQKCVIDDTVWYDYQMYFYFVKGHSWPI